MMNLSASLVSSRHEALALAAIEAAGLQVPSCSRLKHIIGYGNIVTALLCAGALQEPTTSEIDEIFRDFVVRCVNRAPGVGDAVAD